MRRCALLLLLVSVAAACAPPRPVAPAWPAERYKTVLVLPSRVEVQTGTGPMVGYDSARSERVSVRGQMAVAYAFGARGYEVLSPPDSSERIARDRELGRLSRLLLARHGLLPAGDGEAPPQPPPGTEAEEAVPLARAFEADLLVLVGGRGERHTGTEGLLTAILSKGQQSAPPSWLNLSVVAVDGATGQVAGRFSISSGYTEDEKELARAADRALRRVPARR